MCGGFIFASGDHPATPITGCVIVVTWHSSKYKKCCFQMPTRKTAAS